MDGQAHPYNAHLIKTSFVETLYLPAMGGNKGTVRCTSLAGGRFVRTAKLSPIAGHSRSQPGCNYPSRLQYRRSLVKLPSGSACPEAVRTRVASSMACRIRWQFAQRRSHLSSSTCIFFQLFVLSINRAIPISFSSAFL
jgi:hypothetical protein